jgi:hypothetical protein
MWGGTIYNAAGVEVGAYTYADKIVRLASDIASRTAGVVEAIGVAATGVEFALAATNPLASTVAICATGNCSAGDAAMAVVSRRAPTLSRWGWSGARKYRAALETLKRPGTHEALEGMVPTLDEAKALIRASGGTIDRIEKGHAIGGVSRHTYLHINYTTASGAKATIRIQ